MRSFIRARLVVMVLATAVVGTLTATAIYFAHFYRPDDTVIGPARAAPAATTTAASAEPSASTAAAAPAAAIPAEPVVAKTAPSSRPPAARAVHPAADGDVDGDGRADQILLTAPGTLTVRYSGGGSDEVPFDADEVPFEPAVLGAVDADWDGHAEVFVRTILGASTWFASVFRYTDGHLHLVTLNGGQAYLGYGGTVTHQDSWACRPPHTPILTWTGTSEDGQIFHGTETRYQFRGKELVVTSSHPSTVTSASPAPSGCGSVDLTL